MPRAPFSVAQMGATLFGNHPHPLTQFASPPTPPQGYGGDGVGFGPSFLCYASRSALCW